MLNRIKTLTVTAKNFCMVKEAQALFENDIDHQREQVYSEEIIQRQMKEMKEFIKTSEEKVNDVKERLKDLGIKGNKFNRFDNL